MNDSIQYDLHHDKGHIPIYATSQVLFSNMEMKQKNQSYSINRRTRTCDNLQLLHDTGNTFEIK